MNIPYYLQENFNNKIEILQEKSKNNKDFSIPFITDTHNSETKTRSFAIEVVNEVSKRLGHNFVLAGGDLIQNDDNKQMVLDRLINFKNSFNSKENLLLCLGNHDDNSTFKNYEKAITHSEMKSFMFNDLKNVVWGDDFYYYKDFQNHKIRVIVLNNMDIPEYTEKMKYIGQNDYVFSNKQLNWVANKALNLKNDWKVIFLSHCPMLSNSEGFDIPIKNSDAMLKIISAFKNGERIEISKEGEFSYNVKVDYREKGTIVCCLFGHVHCDNIIYNDKIAHVSTTCDKHYSRYGSSPIGKIGEVSEIAFDVLTVSDNNVYLTRFGVGEDRTFGFEDNTNVEKSKNMLLNLSSIFLKRLANFSII